jgi:hypothetical protein
MEYTKSRGAIADLPMFLQKKITVVYATAAGGKPPAKPISDEHWFWTGASTVRGYGGCQVPETRKHTPAHKATYEYLIGRVPTGLELDHLCRIPRCVNPYHLEPVTHLENVRRGTGSKVAKARYAQHLYCPKGHPLYGENLYAHVTRRGYTNKMCRTCQRDNKRTRRAAGGKN